MDIVSYFLRFISGRRGDTREGTVRENVSISIQTTDQ